MSFALLASATRGLFIAMLVIMIVVSVLFGLIVFIALRPVKKPPEEVDPNNVKSMLTRREANLLQELMATKDDEAKRTELINKLRRVKSAQALVDELIAEEEAINKASEEDEENRKQRRAEEAAKAKEIAAKKAAANKTDGEAPVKSAAKSSKKASEKPAVKPDEKPVVKSPKRKPASKPKKDSLEFKPSADNEEKVSPDIEEKPENK